MDRCRCCNLLHNGVAEYLCLSIPLIITHGAPTLFPLSTNPARRGPAQPAAPCPSRRELCNCSKLQNCGWRGLADRMCRDNPAAAAALRTGSAGGASLFRGGAGAESEYEWVEHCWAGPGQGTAWSRLQWRGGTLCCCCCWVQTLGRHHHHRQHRQTSSGLE